MKVRHALEAAALSAALLTVPFVAHAQLVSCPSTCTVGSSTFYCDAECGPTGCTLSGTGIADICPGKCRQGNNAGSFNTQVCTNNSDCTDPNYPFCNQFGDGVRTYCGGSGNDSLTGTNNADALCGLGGIDTISGGGGNDSISAGSGADSIDGGTGNDLIYAGDDDDTINAGGGNDTVWAGDGNDSVVAGAGTDSVYGGPGADEISGEGDDDQIQGQGEGASPFSGDPQVGNVIIGGTGNDNLVGANGDDVINGDAGNDFIIGQGGRDALKGGDGDDTVVGNYLGVIVEEVYGSLYCGGAGNDSIVADGPAHQCVDAGTGQAPASGVFDCQYLNLGTASADDVFSARDCVSTNVAPSRDSPCGCD